MVCESIGQMVGMARAGADKINGRDADNYAMEFIRVTTNGRRVYRMDSFKMHEVSRYFVAVSDNDGESECTCPFFTENQTMFGRETTCKHLIAAFQREVTERGEPDEDDYREGEADYERATTVSGTLSR